MNDKEEKRMSAVTKEGIGKYSKVNMGNATDHISPSMRRKLNSREKKT
jgi:hypothetical protein